MRILVCGGDGTIGWVLATLDSMGLSEKAIPVGTVPLGTGNDMARALKMGGGYEGQSVKIILRDVSWCLGTCVYGIKRSSRLRCVRGPSDHVHAPISRFSQLLECVSIKLDRWSLSYTPNEGAAAAAATSEASDVPLSVQLPLTVSCSLSLLPCHSAFFSLPHLSLLALSCRSATTTFRLVAMLGWRWAST